MVAAREDKHVEIGLSASLLRPEREGGVRAELHPAVEVLLSKREGLRVANKQREVRVSTKGAASLLQILLAPELDRLGKLHDRGSREVGEHALAEELVMGPELAEIPAPVDQDHAVTETFTKAHR